MKTKCPKAIRTTADARRFAAFLRDEWHLATHPDDRFEDYVEWSSGSRLFSEQECDTLNALMEQAFEACEAEGTDIYEIWYQTYNP